MEKCPVCKEEKEVIQHFPNTEEGVRKKGDYLDCCKDCFHSIFSGEN